MTIEEIIRRCGLEDAAAKQLMEELEARETELLSEKEREAEALKEQLRQERVENAMERALTAAGADPEELDYLKYRWLRQGGCALQEDGSLSGAEEAIAALKSRCPGQFREKAPNLTVVPQILPTPAQREEPAPASLAEAIRMQLSA